MSGGGGLVCSRTKAQDEADDKEGSNDVDILFFGRAAVLTVVVVDVVRERRRRFFECQQFAQSLGSDEGERERAVKASDMCDRVSKRKRRLIEDDDNGQFEVAIDDDDVVVVVANVAVAHVVSG